MFFIMTAFCLAIIAQYSFFTTYVLLIEIILGSILGVLNIIEMLFSLYAFVKYNKIPA